MERKNNAIVAGDGVMDILYNTQAKPITVPLNSTQLATYNKNNIKDKRRIIDAVKDHIIPHVVGKDNAFEMWNSLTKLYKSTNENRKMVVREKLRSIRMTETETEIVTSYLTRINQVQDEPSATREVIADGELVRTALNGFSKKQSTFVKGFVSK